MDFLEDENVQHMDWPAMSPDLTPIEDLWSEISRELNNIDNPPTNVAELACIDACMLYTTPEDATRSFKYFVHIVWHDSLALTHGQIFWLWISVVL